MPKLLLIINILILLFLHTSCKEELSISHNPTFTEFPVNYFNLDEELSKKENEYSGLTWYKNKLILLNQYPMGTESNSEGHIYFVNKNEILKSINSNFSETLTHNKIKIVGKGLERFNSYGSGYEAIVFIGDTVYLTIESMQNEKTIGYIVSGFYDEPNETIILNASSLVEIPSGSNIHNFSEEALSYYNDILLTVHEGNGEKINENPKSHFYDRTSKELTQFKFPNIEFRITDLSFVDKEGKFWAMNYYWPGEKKIIFPDKKFVFEEISNNSTHAKLEHVERIVQFQIINRQIRRTEKKSVYLQLENGSRNWEGLAVLDSLGFVIATDRFPNSILAFVPFNMD